MVDKPMLDVDIRFGCHCFMVCFIGVSQRRLSMACSFNAYYDVAIFSGTICSQSISCISTVLFTRLATLYT
jgi:hypothetical protein